MTDTPKQPIGDPAPDWGADTLRSGRFGDVYFSAEDGLGETRHVFLDGIGGPGAWAGRLRFAVGELGFGTGLNFLALWDLWRRTAPEDARLHFISVEGFPLSAEDLARAHEAFPAFAPLARQLRETYPQRTPGFHHLSLDGGRVSLTLLFGPVVEMLGQVRGRIDAWFLDGFAPSKNPEMWSPDVFAQVARLSGPGARLATFSTAGAVRRGLADAGFSVEKRPGFGGKRECLAARFEGPVQAAPPETHIAGKSVAVVGGGIAGRAAARSLMNAGVGVTLFDGSGGDGNGCAPPRVLVSPRLADPADAYGRFMAQAFTHAARMLPRGEAGGSLHLPPDADARARDLRRLEQLGWSGELARPVDAGEASDLAGVTLENGGVYFPQARLLDPAECLSADVETIRAKITAVGDGRVSWDGGTGHFDAVVLAAGPWSSALVPAADLRLSSNRGQLTFMPVTAASGDLRLPLSFGGHVTPASDLGQGPRHIIGSSYEPAELGGDWQAVRPDDHLRPLEKLAQVAPKLADGWQASPSGGWAGVRAVTPDHLPLAGPVPGQAGVYVLSGLGSRGYQTGPLAADLLTAQMTGGPLPVPGMVADALDPARFGKRDKKKTRA